MTYNKILDMKEEKLTLEHLAPYLSYNIMAYGASDYWNITGLNQTKITLKNALHSILISIDDFSVDYDLLLHPLSGLTKEIEHNGEKLNPMIELAKIEANGFKEIKGNYYISDDYYCIDYSDSFGMNTLAIDIVNADFSASRGFIGDSCRNQLKLFNWLYKHHFAVNIPEHLYIDINTI